MEVLHGGRAVVCPLLQLLAGYLCPLMLGWPVTSAEGWCPVVQLTPQLFPCRWDWGLTRVPGAVCDIPPQWQPLPGQL